MGSNELRRRHKGEQQKVTNAFCSADNNLNILCHHDYTVLCIIKFINLKDGKEFQIGTANVAVNFRF